MKIYIKLLYLDVNRLIELIIQCSVIFFKKTILENFAKINTKSSINTKQRIQFLFQSKLRFFC